MRKSKILLVERATPSFKLVNRNSIKKIEKGVYSFGHNSYSQLGIRNKTDQYTPQLIDLKNEEIINIACGYRHTIIHTGNLISIKEIEKGVYSFGQNERGQLGQGNTHELWSPVLIKSLKNEKIKNISCGGEHTIVQAGI
jgi:alpha-tubulin suppressor-like RCC1 family protein